MLTLIFNHKVLILASIYLSIMTMNLFNDKHIYSLFLLNLYIIDDILLNVSRNCKRDCIY
jgi:hypothetical protein